MAENILETRILLRYDTYDNWMNSNTILLQGEVAIARMSQARTLGYTNAAPANTPPAIGLKVGDGVHYFSELPWVQAVAADVYNWAKGTNKPVYTAAEIQGLEAFIEEYESGGGSGDSTVIARNYRLVEGTGDDANKWYLESRAAGDEGWTTDTGRYIDLTNLDRVVRWIGNDLDNFPSVAHRTAQHIQYEIGKLDYTDIPVDGQVVIAVNETDGKISVIRRALTTSDISGVMTVAQGGTGLNTIPRGEVLIGNGTGAITTKAIDRQMAESDNLVPNYVIKRYVDSKTEGLTGAMHFIGDATVIIDPDVNPVVDPNISGYDFSQALPGDVVLSNRKEFVWTGHYWRLLGDEGSYAVKGSISDSDVEPNAGIQQSKIQNLLYDLSQKVDKETGKQLSTNDYTNEDKNKLDGIEPGAQKNAIEHIFVNEIEQTIDTVGGKARSVNLEINSFDDESANKLNSIERGAQVNAIEHIYVNGEEAPIQTVQGNSKSVQIDFTEFTQAEKTKLSGIEEGAQVNKVEKLIINGVNYLPNTNKEISLILDKAALALTAIEGARVPGAESGYEDVAVDATTSKLELARIAKTGNIDDIIQTNSTYVILNCGSSIENI